MRIFGAVGIVASLILVIALLYLPARLIPFATDTAAAGAEGLRTISASMAQTSTSLNSASKVLDSAGSTLLNISETVKETKPLLESAASLVGDVGENTLETTNQALGTAQSAAGAVDTVLRNLAFFGPITGITYDPERSLQQAIGDVAVGLASLPSDLIEVSEKIYETAEGFDEVSARLNRTGADLQELSEDVHDLGERLGTLAVTLDEQAEAVDQLVDRLPTIIWASVVLLEWVMIGVILAHATAIVAGGRLYRENAPTSS